MDEDNTIRKGFEIPEELFHQVRVEVAKRRIKLKEATKEAYTNWLGLEPKPKQTDTESQIDRAAATWKPKHLKYHEKLEQVLSTGNRRVRELMIESIETFHMRVMADRKEED